MSFFTRRRTIPNPRAQYGDGPPTVTVDRWRWETIVPALGLAITLVLALSTAGFAGCKSFNRYQKRADAANTARAEKLKVQAVVQRAEQRYREAVGIKRAQDEINKTLTPLYVQHEAIQAQERSGGASTIYIPSGAQGIPIVQTVPTPEPPK